MDGSSLRIALVGCGQIADAHLQEISKLPGASLVAVCDRDIDLAYQAAVRFAVPGFFSDLDELLDRTRPDVLHITTPPHTHSALAIHAMRRGCHVYVEKPFAVTPDEASEILAVSRSTERLVCIGLDQLWEPVWQRLRKIVADGELGDVVHVDSYQGYSLDGPYGRLLSRSPDHWVHNLPGGVFQNVMPHALAKITDLIHGAPIEVRGITFDQDGSRGFPTELRAWMRWEAQTAHLVFCSAGRPVQRLTRIVGTRATVEVDFDTRVIRFAPVATWPGAFGRIQLSLMQYRASTRELREVLRQFRRRELQYFGGMRALFAEFYDAIRAGRLSPISPERILGETILLDRIFKASMPRHVELENASA